MSQPEIQQFVRAVREGDGAAVQRALASPDVRQQVNAPLFDFGQRAVHIAANHLDVLDVLIEAGADLTLRSDWANGPFAVMDLADDAHARAVMARGAPLTPTAAARLGWHDELRAMLGAAPERVRERGGDGQQPLHQARTVAIAGDLLARGAAIDEPCIDHKSTPAQYALAERPDVCRFLLDRGARPDIFMAAWLGDRALAERLLAADASCLAARVNQRGYAPVPPFNIYCWTLGFLVSPHDVARRRKHEELFAFFMERSPLPVRFLAAAAGGHESEARAALAIDPSLVGSLPRDTHGQLALAIFFGRLDAARVMLALGFDPSAPGMDGGSALHASCWIGHVALVEQILSTGKVDVESRDPTHRSTPLGWASYGAVHCGDDAGDYVGVIDRLVAAGADARAAGNGAGMRLTAMAEGRPDVQAALRRNGAE